MAAKKNLIRNPNANSALVIWSADKHHPSADVIWSRSSLTLNCQRRATARLAAFALAAMAIAVTPIAFTIIAAIKMTIVMMAMAVAIHIDSTITDADFRCRCGSGDRSQHAKAGNQKQSGFVHLFLPRFLLHPQMANDAGNGEVPNMHAAGCPHKQAFRLAVVLRWTGIHVERSAALIGTISRDVALRERVPNRAD